MQHLGNYRTFLYEDVLEKHLRFSGYDVERVINITDVEDKAISTAQDQRISLKDLCSKVEKVFAMSVRY
jgi:cysteinyl-tRNA synthetase